MRKVKFGKEGTKKAKGVKGVPSVVTYLWFHLGLLVKQVVI